MAEDSEYVLEPLREGTDFTHYRGRVRGNHMPILALAVAAEQPSPQNLRRLEHEYSLAAELDSAWAAKPIALTRHERRTILVFEDPGGEPLDSVLNPDKEQSVDVTRFLSLAINLATALGHVHQRGLIHKDIKPENVLVALGQSGDAGQVWLTGFGIASRLRRERQAPAPPEIIDGTLAYMSPEQTGRMNRSMDTRSDLYSLGVTLYQLLTGALPFTAVDPLEWVHCHIARQPVAPADRRAVPVPLSDLLMKLLAKNAEERYQTAAGLEADLRRCLTQWRAHGRIDPFPLGADDSSDRLLIPEKLYGREREVEALLAAFDRVVAQGPAELVLVSGYSGVGKSSVVNELHKVLVPPRGLFAAGKFDQYKRDVPYATLAQAFQMLMRQILVKSEAEVNHWRHAILDALGPNGQLIVNLIPEVEFVIGKQPPVADLPPQEARNRFQLVFRRFLGAFATAEHPLALFLDDLQWLDTATLELLERLATDPDVRHLLLIGAYRDNEVSSSHPLMRTLAAIREAGARAQEIVLSPLGLDDVGLLTAESMHSGRDSVGPLTQLIYEKTGGNPFFTIQFITELEEEGLLRFEPSAATWRWEVGRILAKGYTANVVDLMAVKLGRFPSATQESLKQLACLGNSAEFELLRTVYEDSKEEMHDQLWEAVRAGLVLRTETSYCFLHDRVQEAAYFLIPEQQRAQTHLRIGRILKENTPQERLEEAIFDIVNQLNRGSSLITEVSEREQTAELNLIAGKRAKASTAYASSLKYLHAGRSLLGEDAWEHNHELFFSTESLIAECELLTADMATAEHRLITLAQRARSRHDFAAVTRLQITLYTTLDRSDRAIEVFLDYLRRNGTDWSSHPPREDVLREYNRIWSLVGNRQIEDLIDLPLLDDPDVLDMLDVFTEIVHPAMFFDENLSTLVAFRMVSLCLEHGNCDASCFGFIWFGMFAGPRFSNYTDGFRFGQLGYDLVEKRNLTRYKARTYTSFGTLTPWAKHALKGRELIRRAFDVAYRTGDLTFSAYSWHSLITNYLAVGDPLWEVQSEAEKGLNFVTKAGYGLVVENTKAQLGLIRTLRGLTPNFGSFDAHDYNETDAEHRFAGNPSLILSEFFYWTRKLQARFFAGDNAAAVEASRRAHQLLWSAASQVETGDFRFYAALANAAAWNTSPCEDRQKHFAALSDHHRQLKIWALHCPANFETRFALASAEIARIEGRTLDAEHYYEAAIRSAHDNGLTHCEAVANELAGRFYLARGIETAGYAYLRHARNCYDRWGAIAKMKQLDQIHPHLREERTSASSTTIGAPVVQLDVEAVVKASQAISSEIVLPTLIEKLMRIAVEHAGAERGLLILIRDGEPQVEAEATTGPGRIEVEVRQAPVTPSGLPLSALHYVIRTRERVLLDDASTDKVYSKDEYVQRKRSKSSLCLPIVSQRKLVGALYLENNLATRVFTSDRVTVLQLLASQAAISLENASLYSDLELQACLLQQLPVSAWTLKPDGTPDFVNQVWLEFAGQTLDYVRSHPEAWMTAVHPEDREAASKAFRDGIRSGRAFAFETRSLRAQDGTYRWHLQQAVVLRDAEGKVLKFVGTTTDIDDHKRAAEALRASEISLRQTLDTIPGLVSKANSNGMIELANRQLLTYFGKTTEEMNSWSTSGVVHPDDLPRVTAEITHSFKTGTPFDSELRYRRADGVHRWFQARSLPFRGADGEVAGWYFLLTDIEDRKRAEQALRESEFESRLIVDSIPGLVCTLNPAGQIDLANRRLLDFFGMTLEELNSWGTNGAVHPDDLERVIAELTHTMTTGTAFDSELRYRRGDGVIRWSQTRILPARDGEGRITRWYGLITDIDDRKRAEEALRESERESRLIVDSIPGLIAVLGTSGEIERVNRPLLDYLGRPLEELRQWAVDDTIHPDDRSGYLQAFTRAFATGDPVEYEAVRIRRFDGAYRWLTMRGLPLRDRQGHIVRWYFLLTEIDDRKRAEEALRQAKSDLARINRVTTMGELAASLAHEISQPITGTMTNANVGLRKLASDHPNLDEVRGTLAKIARDAQRAAEIIGRIRSQFEKGAPNQASLNVNEIIPETIALLRDEAVRHNIVVRTELAADLPQIAGDRVQLQQVAMNLIVNSIEAMKEVDGTRELIVRSQRTENDQILVSISDTGAGIPSELAEQIFDPFFTTKPHGTGMGLRISRSIIESHGGRLWAVGSPGRGATFHLNLPVAIPGRS